MTKSNRRSFLKTATAAGAAAFIAPQISNATVSEMKQGKSEVNIAFIGCGGRGRGHLKRAAMTEGVKITAFCDIDPEAVKKTQKVLKDAILFKGPAVVICRRECALMYKRRARELNIKVKPYVVDPDACRGCLICIKELGCPALTLDIENKKVKIESNNCVGCGVCAKICPFKAIRVKGEG